MGKAAIYNPYLDTLGGGERYTISFAKVLAEEGYDVDIEWQDKNILSSLSKRFNLKLLANINVIDSINRGENYDICFWVSDGSIPTLRARNNYIHFQVPFKNVNGRSLLNKMKLFRVNKIICNSNFTKSVIDKEYGVDSVVLYPPVDTSYFKPKKKENQICYVGRFSKLVQSKRHDILIEEFKNLVKLPKFENWKLILAGGIEVGVDNYLNNLKNSIENYDIEIITSPTVEQLKDVYGKSKIFWSAAGYGVDEINDPQKVEHFGITLLESLSAGVVPVVYNAGGPKEIISNGNNGFLWQNKEELVDLTMKIVLEKGLLSKMSKTVVQTSKKYGYEEFKKGIINII